jgi:exopolysaccharide production protein ExoZ
MTQPVTKLEFLPRLESLRGLAALWVVAFHSFNQFIDTAVTGIAPVVLFFALSGFVLARSLSNNPDLLTFFRHRIFRLFPAGIAVVLLLAALHAAFGLFLSQEASFSWANIVLNALMIKHDINGSMWSMTVECAATPLIFLSFWMCVRFGPGSVIPLSLVLFALSFYGPYAHVLGGIANIASIYAFVFGVWMHFEGRRFVVAIQPYGTAIALGALAVLLFCGHRKQTAIMFLLEAASSAALVGLVAFESGSRLFRCLDIHWVEFYGKISYSFYLLHMIGIWVVIRVISLDGWPILAGVIVTTLATILTTPLAWLSWRFIERPCVRLGRRLDAPTHQYAFVAPEPAVVALDVRSTTSLNNPQNLQ